MNEEKIEHPSKKSIDRCVYHLMKNSDLDVIVLQNYTYHSIKLKIDKKLIVFDNMTFKDTDFLDFSSASDSTENNVIFNNCTFTSVPKNIKIHNCNTNLQFISSTKEKVEAGKFVDIKNQHLYSDYKGKFEIKEIKSIPVSKQYIDNLNLENSQGQFYCPTHWNWNNIGDIELDDIMELLLGNIDNNDANDVQNNADDRPQYKLDESSGNFEEDVLGDKKTYSKWIKGNEHCTDINELIYANAQNDQKGLLQTLISEELLELSGGGYNFKGDFDV